MQILISTHFPALLCRTSEQAFAISQQIHVDVNFWSPVERLAGKLIPQQTVLFNQNRTPWQTWWPEHDISALKEMRVVSLEIWEHSFTIISCFSLKVSACWVLLLTCFQEAWKRSFDACFVRLFFSLSSWSTAGWSLGTQGRGARNQRK